MRGRRPASGHRDRDRFISGKTKQNAVKAMLLTAGGGRVLFCSPSKPGSCADITHACQLGLVKLLADGPAVEILADAGYQGLGAQTGGRMVPPLHRASRRTSPTGTTSGSPRTAAQGPLLPAYPRRARHRPSEEPAGTGQSPRPPRVYEPRRSGRRRPAIPPAERGPDSGDCRAEHRVPPRPSTSHPQPCTTSLVGTYRRHLQAVVDEVSGEELRHDDGGVMGREEPVVP
ncbi:transposase family protein [Streptomyces nigra]|uniref:transposase family protein n=1 Tax=Streptomyces nigra TaxID=1827580 RepID=UPI0036BF1A98